MIYLSLCTPTLKEAMLQIQSSLPHIDGVELRADYLDNSEYSKIPQYIASLNTKLSTIFTIRRSSDGGRWQGSEEERLQRLKQYSKHFTYCDVEMDCSDATVSAVGESTQIIRSLHDFNSIPENLEECMRKVGNASIVKAAVMLHSIADLTRLWRIGKRLQGELSFILIGMGAYGLASRILAKKIGSVLTYVSASDEHAAAPGHLSVQEITEYRYSDLREDTDLFAIIGDPIMHSQSPRWHNAVFAKQGANAVYLPFLVDDPASFIELMEELNIIASSITVPHKEGILPFLAVRSPEVAAVAACNTMIRTEAGLHGYNSDVNGFLHSLPADISGGRAMVIGAGGAARAVVYALLERNMDVYLFNRSMERARSLAVDFPNIQVAALSDAQSMSHADIIVQCTSLGMDSNPGDPISDYEFSGRELVYDIIYTPEYTALLQRAMRAGCRVINGREMFDAQAEEQSTLFLNALST